MERWERTLLNEAHWYAQYKWAYTYNFICILFTIIKKSLGAIKIPTDSAENKLAQKSMTVLKTGPKFFFFMTAQPWFILKTLDIIHWKYLES